MCQHSRPFFRYFPNNGDVDNHPDFTVVQSPRLSSLRFDLYFVLSLLFLTLGVVKEWWRLKLLCPLDVFYDCEKRCNAVYVDRTLNLLDFL